MAMVMAMAMQGAGVQVGSLAVVTSPGPSSTRALKNHKPLRPNVDALLLLLNSESSASAPAALEQCSNPLNHQTVIQVLDNLRDSAKAQLFFDWAASSRGFKHDKTTLSSLLRVLARSNKRAEAFSRVKQCLAEKTRLHPLVFMDLIDSYSIAGEMEVVEELFQIIYRVRLKVDVKKLNGTIQSLCTSGRSSDAMELYKMMKPDRHMNLFTYNILLSSLCKQRRTDEAELLLPEMVEAGCVPDVVTYNTLISGLCKVGRVDRAVEVLGEMDRGGVDPDVVTFCALISGLCKANRVPEAYDVFLGMLDRGIVPDSLTYSILLDNLTRLSLVQEVEHVLGHMKRSDHLALTATYVPLIHALIRGDEIENACETYDQAQKAGCELLPYTYHALVTALCKAGNLEKARKLILDMVFKGCSPSPPSMCYVLDGLCKSEKVDEAHDLFREVVAGGRLSPDIVMYNTLMSGFCKSGRLKPALELLEEIKSTRVCAPDVITFNILIDAKCRLGSVDAARHLLEEMGELGLEPNAVSFATLITGLGKRGRVEEAEKVFLEMSCSPDVIAYNSLISALCKAGKMDRAEEILRKMSDEETGCLPDGATHRILIDGYTRDGNLDKAMMQLEELDSGGWHCDLSTYNHLVQKLAEKQDSARALLVLRRMLAEKCDPNGVTFSALIAMFEKLGDPETAAGIRKIMEERRCSLVPREEDSV